MKRKSLLLTIVVLALVLVALGAMTSCGEHEHIWTVTVTKEATCNHAGEQLKVCSVCGESVTEAIAKTKHAYGDWIVIRPATCTLAGLERRYCEICGQKEEKDIETYYQHDWGEWVMVSEPDCDKQGIRTHICNTCKVAESEYVDELGHTFSTEYAYNDRYHWYPTTCGHDDVKGLEIWHQFGDEVVVVPNTCTEPGLKTRTCKDCGYVKEIVTDPMGHLDMTGKWFSDHTGHWHKCFSCDYKMNFASHTYVDGVCTTCAYTPTIADILILTEKADGTYRVDGVRIQFAEIVIPAEIGGIAVTEIGANAFKGATYLEAITLPEGITKIGNSAFSGCTKLTSMVLPTTLTELNSSAFSGCTKLTSINLPVGITKLPTSVFADCKALTAIEIPEGVNSIGMWAFDGCASLATVTLPSTLTSISGMAFSGCASLTAIEIPEGITEIADSTFEGCSALASVTLPSTLTYIGASSFAGCNSLTEITIPAAVTEIGAGAFLGAGLTHAYFESKTIWELTDEDGELADFITPSDPEKAAELLRENAYTWKK